MSTTRLPLAFRSRRALMAEAQAPEESDVPHTTLTRVGFLPGFQTESPWTCVEFDYFMGIAPRATLWLACHHATGQTLVNYRSFVGHTLSGWHGFFSVGNGYHNNKTLTMHFNYKGSGYQLHLCRVTARRGQAPVAPLQRAPVAPPPGHEFEVWDGADYWPRPVTMVVNRCYRQVHALHGGSRLLALPPHDLVDAGLSGADDWQWIAQTDPRPTVEGWNLMD